MSNPYRYEAGFTIEQHVEELIERLGKAVKRINELESSSPVAQQEATTDDEGSLLMNLRKAEAEIEMLRTMGCEANGKMPKRSQSLPPHMVHCGNCDGLGWLEVAEKSFGQDIPSAPEAKGYPAAQPVVAGGAELCRTCGANCIIWFTDNVLWNKYGKFGILCVSCFVKKAEEMGFECTGWKLSPEGWTERLFPTTHDIPWLERIRAHQELPRCEVCNRAGGHWSWCGYSATHDGDRKESE